MRKVLCLVILAFVYLVSNLGCSGCFDNSLNNQVDCPQFSQVRGTNYQINISSSTAGASVKYTTDGSDPKSSSTAVAGNSVVIDFHTEIKAYAYKDDMIDSPVVSYRLPVFAKTIYIKYKSNYNVEYYSYYQLDGNEKKVIEVYVDTKGSDLTWFTDDDNISKYALYQYDENGLAKETVYNAKGIDNEWFTADDVVLKYYVYENEGGNPVKKTEYSNTDVMQRYWTYTYNGSQLSVSEEHNTNDSMVSKSEYTYSEDNLTLKTDYDSDGTTVIGHIDYVYSGTLLQSATERDASDTVTLSYSVYFYDNIEEYTVHDYDSNLNLSKQTVFKGYGTDTQSGLIEYTYNTDNNILTKTEYEDIYKNKPKQYTEYFYTGTQLNSEVIYTSPEKNTKLYSYNYTYTEGNLTRKDKLAEDETTVLEYTEYGYNEFDEKIKETVFKMPDPNSMTISFNLTVSAGYVDGGFYYSGGANFDQEGYPIGTIIDTGSGEEEFIKNIIGKLQDIYNNLEITDNGIIITGSKAGNVTITVRVIDNVITVTFNFNGYDDGDILVNGKIIKTLQGSINLDGSLAGSLNGEITGELTITDADPTWTADQFLKDSYIAYEYDNGLLSTEKLYCNPGADGEWDTADDKINEITTYSYNASDILIRKNVYKGAVSADLLEYQIDYTLNINNKIDEAQKYREYGVYIKCFIDGNMLELTYASLEFAE